MEKQTIIAYVKYVRNEKSTDKKASARQKYEDCALNVLKIINSHNSDTSLLENLSCRFANGKDPWIRKGVILQLEGYIENLTKRLNIFVVDKTLVLSKSAIVKVMQQINFDPQMAREKGIKEKNVFSLAEWYQSELPTELHTQEVLSIWQFLSQCGFSCDLDRAYEIEIYFHRRSKFRGFSGVLSMLKENPFVLMDLPGFSMSVLKNVLSKFNIPIRAEVILYAKMSSILNADARKGHAYVPLAMLVCKLRDDLNALNIPMENQRYYLTHLADNLPAYSLSYTLASGLNNPNGFCDDIRNYYGKAYEHSNIDKNKLKWKVKNAPSGIYLKKIFFNEKFAAEELFRRTGKSDIFLNMLDDILQFKLLDAQKQAIEKALTNKVSIIVGGAGTGKTYTINVLIKILLKNNCKAMILAPSAMAAVLAAKKSGWDVQYQTIHRFARILPSDEDYGEIKDEFRKEDIILTPGIKYIIIDEMSMCSIPMFANFLASIKNYPDISLLLVGDKAQLPAIGPRFFEQIASGLLDEIPITELKENQRSKTSTLIEFATNIRFGNSKIIGKTLENVHYYTGKNYIEEYKQDIREKNILFLTDRREGKYGTRDLNCMLRTLFWDDTVPIEGTDFFVGDPIVTIKNDYFDPKKSYPFKNKDRQIDVYNGTRGHIIGFADEAADIINVELELPEQTKVVPYNVTELSVYMEVAYAITVHKAQGSEADDVVFINTGSQISRNMLYTAVTRAKKSITLIGSGWEDAIDNPEPPVYTKFAFWFKAAKQKAHRTLISQPKELEEIEVV